jgi:hypothetical protein
MTRTEAPSYPVTIFIAGSFAEAIEICRQYCDQVGFCVTVDQTVYVYTGGMESGVRIGLINYPRFPKEPDEIRQHAEHLGIRLRLGLKQDSYTIMASDGTVWISHREQEPAA